MPASAIVVKENYGKDGKTLMAVTPMYKVPGYNPEGGDWFWAKYGADGTVEKEGKRGLHQVPRSGQGPELDPQQG